MKNNSALSTKATALLEQFPGPVRIRASWSKWLFLGIAYAIFSILGFLVAVGGFVDGAWNWLIGGILWGFSWGFCGVTILVRVFRGSMRLVLDAEGFNGSNWLDSGRRYLWQTTGHFVPARMGAADIVAFDDATKKNTFWSRSDRAHLGGNAHLGDDYGFDTRDLAHLMNAWREKVLKEV